ncbi:c-type cytochrome biogenesis protein CcmI [Oceanicoccus sagamiensis]|uniref:C-type cytochrome biogenesis protein CcmI n=1 Tax=Oceanicoccus sagamiensis TaxID=716816 RepID=A0A1X9NKT1_9GAMM|nr:c-type cytochrome biogenesis protein CcmI [Oceanicoccus sagamiensis]ARN75447.1 c-type cytochrome biogenesis protein CcmI [Oceanicoccus sagamiensis]
MPEFLLVSLLLAALAALFVLTPLMLNRSVQSGERKEVNVALFKDRLQELEKDHREAVITEEEFQTLKTELERRLLDDAEAGSAEVAISSARPATSVLVLLALSIPVAGLLIYQQTGAKADWEITQTLKQTRQKAAAGQSTEQDVTQLVNQLNERLDQRPEDPHYLMLVGRTQMELGNYPAATDAYQRLSLVYPEDPSVLAQYAQALYLSSGRMLTDKVRALADKALSLNPQQPTVLGMMGIAYFEEGDFQQAINYWERLLPMLGPVSPNRQMITAGIEQAKELLRESGVEVAETPAPVEQGAVSLQVNVAIGGSIQVDSGASVFVFARAVGGPRMPLAVARMTVADLPATITLDDSMAMAPGFKLSGFEQVELVARISKNGIANRGPGDIEGLFGPVNTASPADNLTLTINQLVK